MPILHVVGAYGGTSSQRLALFNCHVASVFSLSAENSRPLWVRIPVHSRGHRVSRGCQAPRRRNIRRAAGACYDAHCLLYYNVLLHHQHALCLRQVPLDLHLESCEQKFAEIEALTGEGCGPFGADYLERYKHVPVVAATCRRLMRADLPPTTCKFTADGVMMVRKD